MKLVYLMLAAMTIVGCTPKNSLSKLTYPETRRDTTVVDDYHGTLVADPYRWLEDDNSAETAAWVEAQNEVTFGYLEAIPYRDKVRRRITELSDYARSGAPEQVGEYYFFWHNDGLQNQSVLMRQRGLDGAPEPFLDPNTLSSDGTMAVGAVSFSLDDKYMAYSVSASGSDWSQIRVMEVATASQLPDVIEWVKFSGMSWDANGFYYSRYDEPTKEEMLSGQNKNQKVCYHRLGDDPATDKLIYEDKAKPFNYLSGEISRDGRHLFITSSAGTHGTELRHMDLRAPQAGFRTLFKGYDYDYYVVECQDNQAWIYTNDHAPNFRVVRLDLLTRRAPIDVIPEGENKLESVSSVGGTLMASYLEKAVSKVVQYGLDGSRIRDIELSTLGTAVGFDGGATASETFYSLSTFSAPPTIYRLDLQDGTSSLHSQPELAYDPDDFVTEQVFYPSKDGTQVSMFLVYKKGLQLNGRNPVYLYGYGGFNISRTPVYSPSLVMFMEQGGIYATANLRGGGEYGEVWHRGGMLERKQNVFDDFIAAAEWLIDRKYTSAQKIAIAGGSNGGLLVGACMIQRPELFGVALPAVGVMDMLRFHRFTAGHGWVVEYGSADDAAQFEYIYNYSPLHNLVPGTCYPATLVTTADHDDRVVPAHSFKFAATLQAAQGCDNPALIRIDTDAGHGAGKPTSKRIDEQADVFSFLLWNTKTDVQF